MRIASIGQDILSRLGFVGTMDPAGGSLLPRPQTPEAKQDLERDFVDYGQIANQDLWTKYATIVRRPSTVEQMLLLCEEMSNWDLIATALIEIVDECCSTDVSNPGTLWYECSDSNLETKINNMLAAINIEDIIGSQFWHVAAYGNSFERINYSRSDGVQGLTYAHPLTVKRFWLERSRRCIGFRWLEHQPTKTDLYVLADGKTEIPRAALTVGGSTPEDLWYPWDFLHFRRTYRMRQSEYGEAIYDDAQGIYKKLRMAIDQMVVTRAQIQPDRYIVNIDVKDQPPSEQMRTVQRWKQSLRKTQSYGTNSGQGANGLNLPEEYKSFYNAMALDTVFWMAKPTGYTHSIEKLAGTADVPDVYDIEMLLDLFFSIMGMPKAHFGLSKDANTNASGKSLLMQDIRFLRKVRSLRKPVLAQYTWLGYFHAILTGYSNVRDVQIKAKMSDIAGLQDQMRMEMLDVQADVLNKLSDVITNYNLPKEAWIDLVFKKYLRLPDDVTAIMMTALPPEVPMESFLKPAPDLNKLLVEVDNVLRPNKTTIRTQALNLIRKGSSMESPISVHYMTENEVLSLEYDRKRADRVMGMEGVVGTMQATEDPTGPVSVLLTESAEVKPEVEPRNGHVNGHASPEKWRKFVRPTVAVRR